MPRCGLPWAGLRRGSAPGREPISKARGGGPMLKARGREPMFQAAGREPIQWAGMSPAGERRGEPGI